MSRKKQKNNNSENSVLIKKYKNGFSEELAKFDSIEGYCNILKRLPNPDSVLRKTGKGYETLRLLTQESQIATCIQSRKAATKSLRHRVNLYFSDEKRQTFYDNLLRRLKIHKVVDEVLNAPLFGFQPIEIVWEAQDGFIVPKKIQAKPQEWFFFDANGNLMIRLKGYTDGFKIEEDSKKFLCPQHNSDYLNPYGLALLSLCFWNVAFKKGGLQFWMKFIEKYAIPYFIGKYEPGASDDKKEEILNLLVSMVQDAVGVIPNDSSVEIKEAAGKGTSAQIFKTFVEFLDKEISKTILGQTLTTEPGESGSYALGQVHNQVRQDIVESDIRLVEETINTLLLWIHELNFDDENIPSIEFYSPKPVTQEDAGIDTAAYNMGVRFNENYFTRKYGYKPEEFTIITQPQQDNETNFSESINLPKQNTPAENAALEAQKKLDEFMDNFTDEGIGEYLNERIKPIIQEFAQCKDADAAMESLAVLYPGADTKELEDKLTKAMFLGDLLGKISVKSAK